MRVIKEKRGDINDRVDTIEDDLESEIKDNKEKHEEYDDDISSLKTRVEDLERKIKPLEDAIKKLKKEKK